MLGHLTNFKHKDFYLEITLFDSSVMIVDKTRIGKDVHGNNDNIDINEPGPASDVNPTLHGIQLVVLYMEGGWIPPPLV